MAQKKIEHAAAKGQELTLDELAAFIQDAMRSGATGSETIHVRTTWGAKLRQVAVDIELPAGTPSMDKA